MDIIKLTGVGCPIIIGSEEQSLTQLTQLIPNQQVCIVTNDKIADFYLASLQQALNQFNCKTLIIPDGEIYKNWDTLHKILDFLFQNHFQRNATIIGLGGGVILDIVGFAASCYLRGINFISIPTTLLAQADAAIGGKTGINFQQAKNMLGAFYSPKIILLCPAFLLTLAEREFRAGIAEMIKHALIADEEFFLWLENHLPNILKRDIDTLTIAISKNAEIKTRIVSQDEKEQNLRIILNFGHTIGHALEAASDYQLLHGEAVAIGMLLELSLSNNQGLPSQVNNRVAKLLQQAGLPLTLPHTMRNLPWQKWLIHDKKSRDDSVLLPLLSAIGQTQLAKVPLDLLQKLETHYQ